MKNTLWRACLIGTTVYVAAWLTVVLITSHGEGLSPTSLKGLVLSSVAVCIGIAFGALIGQDRHRQ